VLVNNVIKALITGIKYIHIENIYFEISIVFHNLLNSAFLFIWEEILAPQAQRVAFEPIVVRRVTSVSCERERGGDG